MAERNITNTSKKIQLDELEKVAAELLTVMENHLEEANRSKKKPAAAKASEAKKTLSTDSNTVKSGTNAPKKKKTSGTKKKNPHDGHRKRLRERYLKNDLEGFQPHEVMELLLFYPLPRVNTNEIAHKLLDQFGSLAGVMDADPADLMKVEGVNINTAVYLNLLPKIYRLYQLNKLEEHISVRNTADLFQFLRAEYSSVTKETMKLIYVDDNLNVIGCESVAKGSTNVVRFTVRDVTECVIRRNCNRIIISHNHPRAKAVFSAADIAETNELKCVLKRLNIQLLDHIVVGKNGDCCSMLNTALLSN